MDSQQAKQILGRYRPGVDDDDPQFAEALALARRTPELSRWLDQQVALDAAIRAKLRSAAAPVGLKTRILANAKVEPPALAWWRHPGWIATALAALVVVAMVWPRAAGFPAYRAKMVAFVSREYKLDLKTKSFEEFRQALAKGKYPAKLCRVVCRSPPSCPNPSSRRRPRRQRGTTRTSTAARRPR